MLGTPARPNFFPGQLVDFRDFNRLSRQGEDAVALFCRSMFPGGGVVVDALGSFAVEPQEALTIRLRPGLAVLPDGDTVILESDRLIDLAPYAAETAGPVVVAIAKSVVGADRFVDPADPAVEGFRTVRVLPDFQFGIGQAPEGSIELFRVALGAGVKTLRLATDEEGWTGGAIAAGKDGSAVVDVRFRPAIVPQTYVPVPAEDTVRLRSALFALEKGLRAVEKLYLIADPFGVEGLLTQVHAEALARPFQPLRVAYLTAELADRLSRFLELLRTKLGAAGTKYADEALVEVIRALVPFRVREIVPKYRSLKGLVTAQEALDRFVTFAEENYRRIGIVEEALADLQHRSFRFDERLLLAGYLFQRVDLLDPSAGERFAVRASNPQLRRVRAAFGDGATHEEKGLFFAQGVLDIDFQVPDAGKLVGIVRREYVRRGTAKVHYEVNGRAVGSPVAESVAGSNRFAHRALVLPADMVVPGTNRLRITVEQSDLEFGFFETAIYQPETTGVVQ